MPIIITIPKDKKITKDFYVHKDEGGIHKNLPKNKGRVKEERDYVWKTLKIESTGLKHGDISWKLIYNTWNNISSLVAPDTKKNVTVEFESIEKYIEFIYQIKNNIIGHREDITVQEKDISNPLKQENHTLTATSNETEIKIEPQAEDKKTPGSISTTYDSLEFKLASDSPKQGTSPKFELTDQNQIIPSDKKAISSKGSKTERHPKLFEDPSRLTDEQSKTTLVRTTPSIFNKKNALTIFCILTIKIILVTCFYTTIKSFILNYLTLGAIATFFCSEVGIITVASISVLAITAISISYSFGVKKYAVDRKDTIPTKSNEIDKYESILEHKEEAIDGGLNLDTKPLIP
jgi:hypothetical protein